MEELDAEGNPVDPEPVSPDERLPVEVIVRAADTEEAKNQLVELLELAYGLETEGPPEPPDPGKANARHGKGG